MEPSRASTRVEEEPPRYATLFELEKGDRVKSIPRRYMLVCRVSLLLRGLGAKIGLGKLSMAALWRREARAARNSASV